MLPNPPEEPTGVFDLSLETTSGSSSAFCTMVCTGDTGSNDGYSNTSVLSLNDMLSFLELFLLLREDLPVETSAPTQVTFSFESLPTSSSSPSLDSPGSRRITPLPCDLACFDSGLYLSISCS